MMLFDTHAHLHFPEFAEDLDRVLARARAAGVRGIVTIGTDRDTNPAAVALAERYPDVYASVGIHPHDAAEATEEDFAEMERLARLAPRWWPRRDGARLLPQPVAAPRPGAGLPPPARPRPRRSASR